MQKLIDFVCPNCGAVREGWEGEIMFCNGCSYVSTWPNSITDKGVTFHEMLPRPWKNNFQRARVNDEVNE